MKKEDKEYWFNNVLLGNELNKFFEEAKTQEEKRKLADFIINKVLNNIGT